MFLKHPQNPVKITMDQAPWTTMDQAACCFSHPLPLYLVLQELVIQFPIEWMNILHYDDVTFFPILTIWTSSISKLTQNNHQLAKIIYDTNLETLLVCSRLLLSNVSTYDNLCVEESKSSPPKIARNKTPDKASSMPECDIFPAS